MDRRRKRTRDLSILLCLGAIALASPSLVAAPAGTYLLDFGTAASPLAPGFLRVTGSDVYRPERGYGFLAGPPRGFHLPAPRVDARYQMPVTEHFRNHGTPLLVDGVRSARDIRFRIDLPDGRYRVTVSIGDLLRPLGSISLLVNGTLVEENIALHHGLYRGIRYDGSSRRPSATGFYDRVHSTAEARDGHIEILLRGDESEYRRLMRIEEGKEQPSIFLGTRKLRDQKPPYQDVGEPFHDIPLLGIEVRPHVESPVRMPAHGKLEYAGTSRGIGRVVEHFNTGRWDGARAALDAAVREDPLAAALCGLWLLGWPPVGDEEELLSLCGRLLERHLAAQPENALALEMREKLEIFRRARKRHVERSEPQTNHFIENVRAYHLFQLAEAGDPLYWKSRLYAGRIAYMLDPNRWTATAGTGRKLMEEILERFPANRYARYYVRGEFDTRSGPWAMKDYTGVHRGAPIWAARLHECFNRLLDVSEWWVENKQKPDGSLGGGWGDDVEIVGLFGYYGFVSDGASPLALRGARNLVHGMYRHSGDIEPESGYLWHAADTEHSAEWTGDTLPMMLLIDYGNPLWIEHGLKTAKLMRDLWTGKNARGQRLFRANYTGGLGVGSGLQANDSAINMRATFPAERVLWYNRHPGIQDLFVELADGWLAAALSTEKGKPRGFIPPNVAFADGELGGRNAPAWYEGNHAPGTVNYNFGAYKAYHLDLLTLAYQLTDDRKYLEPIRLEAEAHARMKDVVANQNAAVGSPPFLKHGLAPSAERWEKLEQEVSSAATVGADRKEAERPRLSRREILAQCDQVVHQLRARWPVMTTEASATDRVAFVGIVAPYLIYTGGSLGRGVASLTASVTYTDIGRDFAAYVTRSSSQELRLHLYAFREGPVEMGIRPWDLEVGGTYAVTVAADRDDDGKPDGPGKTTRFVLEQRGQPCPITIEGRTPHVVTLRQTVAGRGQAPTADLSLWEGDIEYHAEKGYLTVRVHNTGTREATEIQVTVHEGVDPRGEPIARGTISHLDWPRSFLPQTVKLGWRHRPRSSRTTITAVVDPENRIQEISETNNRATRTLEVDTAATGAAPERATGAPARGRARGRR